MRKLLAFFTSIKLASVLIALIALGCVVATLLPQDLPAADYAARYGQALGGFLVRSGLARYFRSPLFVIPSFAFFANLSACSVQRLLRELRKKGKRRHGPDLLHLGLILLVVGAMLSASGRKEYSVALAPGESALLPDGRVLRLDDFDYEAYEDGRPREWTSMMTVLRDGRPEIEARALRVNRPLRLGAISLYQASRQSLAETQLSGIRAVVDPGYRLVLASLLVAAAGVFVSFAGKSRGGPP